MTQAAAGQGQLLPGYPETTILALALTMASCMALVVGLFACESLRLTLISLPYRWFPADLLAQRMHLFCNALTCVYLGLWGLCPTLPCPALPCPALPCPALQPDAAQGSCALLQLGCSTAAAGMD